MRDKGLSRKAVLAALKKFLEQDRGYADGKILCSMCTSPHSIARTAHRWFLNPNLGDAGLFPGSLKLEKEAVQRLAALLNGENSVGFIVSGGTEANLLALWAARNMACACNPEVVLPESAHFSFKKICNLLGLKPVYASLDSAYRVKPSSVEKCITRNTVAIVGTAGTTELGTVDPIDKLSAIAVTHGVYLHVDAAFGGLIIPFLNDMGYEAKEFDFRLEGVKSITVDPHKMGMTPIPAGGILFRDSAVLDYIKTETPYLTEKWQYTFAGTRSGASAAAAWAVFEHLGREGFKKIVRRCMRLTKFLSSRLEALGFTLVVQPQLNIVAFKAADTKQLVEKLRQHGWLVSYIPRLDCIRIVIMPHIRKRHLAAFLKDLSHIAQADASSLKP
ncbi:MAG: tyrosine decarboxylase MfnA [Candidatus Bathyarchaeota archaeon]|nr:tyrosine decarboxylase MfnA [Candidatus Bathyarchaeota archaeon]